MTKQELEQAIENTGNPRWRDAVDPELVDDRLRLAINRCLVRQFAVTPPVVGEFTQCGINRADVEAELLSLGYDPAYYQAAIDGFFPQ